MARRHRPLEVVIHGRRECSVDGLEVIGHGPTLRHIDEAVPVVTPDPEDAPSVARALEVARTVAARMRGADDAEIARAVTEALYTEGLLRRRRGDRGPRPLRPAHVEVRLAEHPPRLHALRCVAPLGPLRGARKAAEGVQRRSARARG